MSAMAYLLEAFQWFYRPLLDHRKRCLFGPLAGSVLELGPGTGVNFDYLSSAVQWIGLEPNPELRVYCARKAAARGLSITWVSSLSELPDRSLDGVMCSLVLCSVDDPADILKQVRRCLKPGGRFAFVEHVEAPDGTWLRRIQRFIRPLWSRLADGCDLCRDTGRSIEAVFPVTTIERFCLPLPMVGPHISGFTIKPAD